MTKKAARRRHFTEVISMESFPFLHSAIFTMKVKDFHSMDGHAARQSGRLSMMRGYFESP